MVPGRQLSHDFPKSLCQSVSQSITHFGDTVMAVWHAQMAITRHSCIAVCGTSGRLAPHTPATTNPYVSCQQRILVSCILLSGHFGQVEIWRTQVALKQHVLQFGIAVEALLAQCRALTVHHRPTVGAPRTPATTNPYVSCQQHILVSCILLSSHLEAVASWPAQVVFKQHV
jgi:hypothetical protein